MKQHITVEQLKELSSEARKKLLEWYQPKYIEFVRGDPNYQCYRPTGHEYGQDGFCKVCFNPSHEKKYSSMIPPLLSIGQMIEFLDETNILFKHDYVEDIFIVADYDDEGTEYLKPEEWCDALWEATKEVLEK